MSELEEEKPSVEELLSVSLIQQIRNYDLLMHILAHFDEETASSLYDLHESGGLYGPMPFSVVEE